MACARSVVRQAVSLGLVAVLLAASAAFADTEVIVDDVDEGFSVLMGTWTSLNHTGQWGTSYQVAVTNLSAVTAKVEWRPTLPGAAEYNVSVWYYSTGGSRPNNAHYAVYYDGGMADVYINQQLTGSEWVSLGNYDFAMGTDGHVVMDNQAQAGKMIAADAVRFSAANVAEPEFRAFWADAFHMGMKSTTEIDAMVAHAVEGNYNAIIAEVLAYQDNMGVGHGAYWNSAIVPKASDIIGGIDPLAYLLQQAHGAGIEVHCWIVTYRVCTTWPPNGNGTIASHPEWIAVSSSNAGGGVAPIGDYYFLDPGSPDVQEYLISIVKELVSTYAIDGIHWDYVRYTSADAGYPSDSTYDKSGLARFQVREDRTDTPPATGDEDWDDFRRLTITELIQRCGAEMAVISTNPRQPLRHSASLITWVDAPAEFEDSSAYGLFQNWRAWMESGYLDAAVPMAYFREYNTDQAQWYRNWVDAAIGWRYDRHMVIGPGIYLNAMADSITQMQYARDAEADGLSTYSYVSTNKDGVSLAEWYPYVASELFAGVAPVPTMPWRDPATATEGTLFGRVTNALSEPPGEPVENATVQVGTLDPVQTDGNGYYVVTRIPTDPLGTWLDVRATKEGLPTAAEYREEVVPGEVRRVDLVVGGPICMPADLDCDGDVDLADFYAFSACFNGPNRPPACAP